MYIELPAGKGFTIYSKSFCINCDNIKKLLDDNKLEYNIINCDNYLNENKDFFLEFMKLITRQECKMFPIVFNNQKFIGSYKDAVNEIHRICFDIEDNF
jgi:glutaredoxin